MIFKPFRTFHIQGPFSYHFEKPMVQGYICKLVLVATAGQENHQLIVEGFSGCRNCCLVSLKLGGWVLGGTGRHSEGVIGVDGVEIEFQDETSILAISIQLPTQNNIEMCFADVG